MAERKMLSAAQIFTKYAPTFAQVELIPGGFANPHHPNEFYLRPARGGKPLEFGYMATDGGPPSWPYIDLREASIRVDFHFDGMAEGRTPYQVLRDTFFEAISKQAFTGRTFRLVIPEKFKTERTSLRFIVEGLPILGLSTGYEMWASNVSAFLPYDTPEYKAYDTARRYEFLCGEVETQRRGRDPHVMKDEALVAAHTAQASLAA